MIVVGAGFGGVGFGIKLRQSGESDFVILEKSPSVGGVWFKNDYPGSACDVPSHLYSFSFSFAPRPDWPHKYARRADILHYLVDCAEHYGLVPHLRLSTEVTEARWDDGEARWTVRAAGGRSFRAPFLIAATGQLSMPYIPRLAGSFAGAAFHAAEWNSATDLTGRTVAVIGTGASAIQIVPAIAPAVERLYVFQRHAAYVLPKDDDAYRPWQIAAFENIPGTLWLSRLLIYLRHEASAFGFITWRAALRLKRRAFRRHLRRAIEDEALVARLTPDYRLGCKRILLSNDFYPALARANVELVTENIAALRDETIVTADGAARAVDTVIYATGFQATDFLAPIRIVGRGGRELHEVWDGAPGAYLGIAVAGFPNLFMLYGPNTNLAHNSVLFMIEGQIAYVLACLRRLRQAGAGMIEVDAPAQQRFVSRLRRRLGNSIWAKGCTSWFLTGDGLNVANWPGYSLTYRLRTLRPDWRAYIVR